VLVRFGILISLEKSKENEVSGVNSSSSVKASFRIEICLPHTGLNNDLDDQTGTWRHVRTIVE
jgi:hypothetical protein